MTRPQVERYDMFGVTDGERAWASPETHPQGDWVRYEDHAALISSLEAERDAAQTSHAAARENFLTMQGAAAVLLKRAEAAEAREKVLREALEPFGEYMQNGGDLDNKGNPLPDDQGVGWVYLTMADFRRARTALGGPDAG